MDATRTKFENLLTFFYAAIDAGASKVIVADTVGIMRPLTMSNLIKNLNNDAKIQKSNISIPTV